MQIRLKLLSLLERLTQGELRDIVTITSIFIAAAVFLYCFALLNK